MDEQKYTYRVQKWVLAGGLLLFLLLILAWMVEGSRNQWKKVQKEFGRVLVEQSGNPESFGELERGIFQVDLPQFNRSDRCISCHFGIGDPRMAEVDQPHRIHPGSFLEDHPVEDYGCTMCHGGQPMALDREGAFGRADHVHWPHPLLEQPYIQSSCGKCHLAIFDMQGTLSSTMEGMDTFLRGRELFSREGCLGCHRARGVGGILGPDLTQQGEKTQHEYSFQNIVGEQSVSRWLKEHFRDPEMVSPGSQMLKIDLEEEELDALATFVMGLAKPDIPFDYFSMETLHEFKGIRDSIPGHEGFDYLCSSCHGKQGEGKSWEQYKTGIPAIGKRDFLRVASEDFIRFTMEKGRSLKQMASWTSSISGMKAGELDGISAYLNARFSVLEELPAYAPGRVSEGLDLYEKYCATCHGEEGKGGLAVALNQEGLLNLASPSFILETLVRGRGHTAMPAWPHLESGELNDLVSAIRSWHSGASLTASVNLPEADTEEGVLRYRFLCSRCHGEFGQGETGPAIINRDFLEVASDGFLYRTIAEGRAHTAMFGWSLDVYNQEKLGRQDISNLIGFMRERANETMTYILPGRNPGDAGRGGELFQQHCAECHGTHGEGKVAPALNNQEFLSAASNGFLLATMTLGRDGTAMPAWGYPPKSLTQQQREDLAACIRAWQRIRIKY